MKTLPRSTVWVLAALLAAALPAPAQTVVVAMGLGYEDQLVDVPVSADAAPGIAAMACRVVYDTASLDVTASSAFFATFAEQYLQSGVGEPAAVTATIGGETFDAPFLVRPHAAGIAIAGARRPASTDPAPVLFTLHVTLKAGASPGLYPITLESAIATSAAAGYPAGGEAIPLLLGYDPATGVYPVIAAITPGNDPVTDGSVRFYPADTDRDGLADAWELFYYGDLTTADASTDTDNDRLPALLEQLFASNPLATNGSHVTAVRPANGRFSIFFPLRDNTAFSIESSEDYLAWSPDGIDIMPRADLGFGPDWSIHEASLPTAGRLRLFMRVGADPAPVPDP